MSAIDYQKRVLALAGLLQAIHLVVSIAKTGMASQDSIDNSLRSIFVTNPDSISEVYAGTSGVRFGLKLVAEILGRFDVGEHGELVRYALSVIALERKLAARPQMLRELGARIASIDEQRMLNEDGKRALDSDVVAALADAYEETLSQIEPRIKISGKRNFLASEANIHRIRALLLAAVRSAVLWYQVGGRRWQLLLARRQLHVALEFYV